MTYNKKELPYLRQFLFVKVIMMKTICYLGDYD